MTNIKTRTFSENNYKAIWHNGKTFRIALDPKQPITEIIHPEFYDVGINSRCNGQCPWCLTEDTQINTESGISPISEIAIGEKVWVYNESKKKQQLRKVDQLHIREYSGEMIHLTLENNSLIKITPNHKVYTDRGWVQAGDLVGSDKTLHVGLNTHRLEQNPLEKRFAVDWEKMNNRYCSAPIIEYLLGEYWTERDAQVAATIIQWLGSPVGSRFIADVNSGDELL
jgi:Pretoxin HINT domain